MGPFRGQPEVGYHQRIRKHDDLRDLKKDPELNWEDLRMDFTALRVCVWCQEFCTEPLH